MRIIQIRLLLVLIFCSVQCLVWAEGAPKNSCVTCHDDMFQEMTNSVHTQHGILCQNCHGGDPTKAEKETAKAEGTGYAVVPDKKQLVKICGECHANIETMNSFGIPTDQMSRYLTSTHGKKLFAEESNVRVAACTDCHGYHDVVKVTDPNSPVYPLNIPKTCNQCHGDVKLMTKYNHPSDIFKKYENSVHGQALFEKKDISVAQCASCHGSHGAVPPGVKNVANTCGKCHINEQKSFEQSPHAMIEDKDKFTGCISCHSNHDIVKPGAVLYEQTCVKCHDAKSTGYQMGMKLATMIKGSQDVLATAGAAVKQASSDGLFVEEETALLEAAKSNVLEMAPLQHSLSVDKVSEHYQKAMETTKTIQSQISEKRKDLDKRKIALIPIWIFIVIMSYAFWVKYKDITKH